MGDIYRKVFETRWFSIEATSNRYSNNEPYYRLSCNDSVAILAVTPEQKIILIREFRPALGSYLLELPAGYVDSNESSNDAIKRELREETGFVCDSVNSTGALRIAPSRINNTLYTFFGKGANAVDPIKENIEVVLVTQNEFKRLIADREFVLTSGIAMYFLAQQHGFL